MTIQCYGDQCEEAADAAVLEIERLDSLLSVGNPESEIIMLKGSGSAALSDDSAAMVEEALSIYDGTGGAFDITVYPLMALWGFIGGNPAVPDEDALHETLSKVGSDKLHYETAEKSLTLGDGQGIDLGGIAKGYTSDRLMEIFAKYQLRSAMVSLGGNVQLYQTKPDGSLWRCGIRDPFAGQDSNALLGILSARDCAVITSGAYERCFADENGTVYRHILDPKTGYPAQSGISSATIVSGNGIATAVFTVAEPESKAEPQDEVKKDESKKNGSTSKSSSSASSGGSKSGTSSSKNKSGNTGDESNLLLWLLILALSGAALAGAVYRRRTIEK